jgi:4-amino-4-deoxy-L-arabinose transferase-like glycosyltransferase
VSVSAVADTDVRPSAEAPTADDLDRRTYRRWFAGLVAFGFVFRVAYVLGSKRDDLPDGDQLYYSAQAVTIANGRWFEAPFEAGAFAADHTPLTALVIAPVSWSDGHSLIWQRLVMTVVGTVVVVVVGLLARWLFGRRIGLVATALAVVYANLWMNDGLVMSESLAALGVAAVLLFAYMFDLRRTWVLAVAMGLAVGFAGLARAELLLLGVMVVAPMTLTGTGPWARRLAHLGVAGLAAVALISPWVIRNQVRFDDPTFMSTQDGQTLLGANCPSSYGVGAKGFWAISCVYELEVPPGVDQSVRSKIMRDAAFEYVGDHLDEVPGVVLARLGRGFSVWKYDETTGFNTAEGRERWASTTGVIQFWVLGALAVWGVRRWPSRQARWPALACVALSVLIIAVLYGLPRFRIAAEIVVVLGAAVALDAIRRWLRRDVRDQGMAPNTA